MVPSPAKVVMMPPLTWRMRLFLESAMYILPFGSKAMPCGEFNCALTAGPPSPEKPAREVPAISVTGPLPLILKTQFEELKERLPEASRATRAGCPMEILAAAAGVAGGAPPATVDMEYCCASAMEAPASSEMNLNMRKSGPGGMRDGS